MELPTPQEVEAKKKEIDAYNFNIFKERFETWLENEVIPNLLPTGYNCRLPSDFDQYLEYIGTHFNKYGWITSYDYIEIIAGFFRAEPVMRIIIIPLEGKENET